MTETWLPIYDHEDLYEISDQGCIRSYSYRWKSGEKFLKPFTTMGCDSLQINLVKNGHVKTYIIARLVLTHFKREPDRSEIVKYLDGNLGHISINNLEWSYRKQLTREMVMKIQTLRPNHTIKQISKLLEIRDSLVRSAFYSWPKVV